MKIQRAPKLFKGNKKCFESNPKPRKFLTKVKRQSTQKLELKLNQKVQESAGRQTLSLEQPGSGKSLFETKDEATIDIDRIKQVNINQKIAQHANRKELQQAYELFEEALQDDLANSHTFAAMVNAAVRCANMPMAEQVISTMLSKGRKLKDVVLYTTLMKGYCAQGNLTKALKLYQDMLKKSAVVQPNIRTINTLLRGCVQMGEVYIAEAIFQQMQKELKISPDVSSWEYLIILLSQGLLVDKILPIVGRIKSDPQFQSGMISVNINLARAAGLSGEYKLAKKCLQQAINLIDATPAVAPGEEDYGEVDDAADQDGNPKKTVLGGKRAWKSKSNGSLSVDEKRNQSLRLYREHIREEWKYEVEALTKFVDHRIASASVQSAFDFIYPFFCRILSFDSNMVYSTDDSTGSIFNSVGTRNPVVVADVRKQVFNSLCYKFGLDALLKKSCNFCSAELLASHTGNDMSSSMDKQLRVSSKKVSNVSLADMINFQPNPSVTVKTIDKDKYGKIIDRLKTLQSRVDSYFDAEGYLNFSNIFPSLLGHHPNGEITPSVASGVVKLEICSGAGEWAVTQAKSDPTSAWLTLELRHDRVYQTVTKMIYSDVQNLCVVGGDAMMVLPRHIGNGTIGNIFVNHPEPPQQTGGDDSEGHHLLNESFFKEAERILVENGMLTIVTDNAWYGKFLCRLLSSQSTLRLRSLTTHDGARINSSWLVHHHVDNFTLWVGDPGKEAGHMVDASSYFDRLWKRGDLQERYFLVLLKPSSLKCAKIPLKIPAITTKKSIKFEDDEEVSEGRASGIRPKTVSESVESILSQIRSLEALDSSLTTRAAKNKQRVSSMTPKPSIRHESRPSSESRNITSKKKRF